MRSASLSVFDLDGTLLVDNSSFRFGSFLYRQGELPLDKVLKVVTLYGLHRYLGVSMSRVHQNAFELFFRGRSFHWLAHTVQTFLQEELSDLIHQPAQQRLLEAQERGDTVAIFSSGPDFLVGPLAHHFGVQHWRASHYPIDSKGQLTTVPRVFHGEDKARELQLLANLLEIERSRTIAYSDSYCDLAFLQSAGRAVAVRPDRTLRRYCHRNAWEIL